MGRLRAQYFIFGVLSMGYRSIKSEIFQFALTFIFAKHVVQHVIPELMKLRQVKRKKIAIYGARTCEFCCLGDGLLHVYRCHYAYIMTHNEKKSSKVKRKVRTVA